MKQVEGVIVRSFVKDIRTQIRQLQHLTVDHRSRKVYEARLIVISDKLAGLEELTR